MCKIHIWQQWAWKGWLLSFGTNWPYRLQYSAFFRVSPPLKILLHWNGRDVGEEDEGRLVGYKWVRSACTGLAPCTTDLSDYEWFSSGGPSLTSLDLKVLKKLEADHPFFGFTIPTHRGKKRVSSPRQLISSPDHRLDQIAPKCSEELVRKFVSRRCRNLGSLSISRFPSPTCC